MRSKRMIHSIITVLLVAFLMISTKATTVAAEAIKTKQMLVMMDDKFDGNHLQRNLVELVKQDRRRRQLEQKDDLLASRSLRGSSNNHGESHNADDKQDQEFNINIKKEIHHSKTGKRTIHIEVHEDAVSLITSIDGVSIVEEDGPVWIAQVVDAPPPSKGTQTTVTNKGTLWGIDRLDQRSGLDSIFSWDNTASDVDVYILDTGVYADHDDFYGRVQLGEDFYNIPSTYGNTDCHGHGTHVASTAAGLTYGIAKSAHIIPVRAVGCDGKGSVSALISSIQYAIDTSKTRNRKSVVNISLVAGYSVALNTAVNDAVQSGLVIVVAAGNNALDACNYSPSSELSALTVGGISMDDSMLGISNYGSCVDIFAPGDGITAASPAGPSEVASKRGTSMASPNVAGVAAVVWSRNPSQKNTWVVNEVIRTGVKSQNVVDKDCAGKINPDLIVQLPASSSSYQSGSKNAYVASGQRLRNDFFDWPMQFTTGKTDGNICVMFDAIITNGDKSGNGASIGVSFASAANAAGHRYYEVATCKSTEFSYYTMYLPNGYQPTISKNAAVLSTSKALPNQLVNGYNPVSMYARITRSGITSTIEIGTGNVPGQNVLASAKESSSSNLVSYVSFSSTDPYEVTYSNVRWCDGSVPTNNPTSPTKAPLAPTNIPTLPTNAPTSPTRNPTAPSLSPSVPTINPTAPSNVPTTPTRAPTLPTRNPTMPTRSPTILTSSPTKKVTDAPTNQIEYTFAPSMYSLNDAEYVAERGIAKGIFQKFWNYIGAKPKVCFSFQARGLSNVLVALSESDEESFQFKRAEEAYIFMIGKTNVPGGSNTISRGATELASSLSDCYLDPDIFTSYKFEIVGADINVWVTPDNGDTEELLISFEDDASSMLNPKFLSLSGVGKGDIYYKNIASC